MERYDNPFEYHDTDYYVACVGNNGGTDNFDIREGYKKSVNLLINAIKHGEIEDILIYPIVYNARHSVELSLKIIIENILYIYEIKNIKVDEKDKKKIYTHDIKDLDSIIIKYYKIDSRIDKIYDEVNIYLEDYFFDVKGDAFKYKDDFNGNPHMITHGISSISIDTLEDKFDKLMCIFDCLISELFYLCEEYRIKTFTKNLSREDIRNIALTLPERNKWTESCFTDAKHNIKAKYRIGSKEFTEALNIIQNHREFCVMIGMEKVFGNISEDELRKYARLVIFMKNYHKEFRSRGGSLGKTAEGKLWRIQDIGQKRNKLAEKISDNTLTYLMTFREYGKSSCFSERIDGIFSYIQELDLNRIDTLGKVSKLDTCKQILSGMKLCGQVTYHKIIKEEFYKLGVDILIKE